jgi:hypothetical protein
MASRVPEKGAHVCSFLAIVRDTMQPREEDVARGVDERVLFDQTGQLVYQSRGF